MSGKNQSWEEVKERIYSIDPWGCSHVEIVEALQSFAYWFEQNIEKKPWMKIHSSTPTARETE